MEYKDKNGKPVTVYEVYDAKKKLITVTAEFGAADLYVNGKEGQWFKENAALLKLDPRSHPKKEGLTIKKVVP
jgi:hypothetical protein